MPPSEPNPNPPPVVPPNDVPAPAPAPLPVAPAPTPAPVPPPGGQIISGGFNPSASTLPANPATPAAVTPATVAPAPAAPQAFVGSFETPGATVTQAPLPAAPIVATGPKRRFMKPLLIGLSALVVLGGASAAAYVGVILPNKPANVLRAAILNSVQEKQVSADGKIETSAGSFKATFSSAVNTDAKSADAKLDVTFSGVSFPVEGRLVDQSAYFKVGDLNTISSLIGAFSPDAGTAAQNLSQQVSNKWIAVDSTIIKEDPTAKCLMAMNWSLTKADIDLMQKQYAQHPFTTISSTNSDTVGGQKAEKFVLNINDDGFTKFGDSLKNLSIVKTADKCPGVSNAGSSAMRLTANKTTGKTTPLTVWVDKATKHISRIAYSSKDGSEAVDLKYGHVSISAPADATPVLQFVSALEKSLGSSGTDFTQLLGGGSTSGNPSTN
jgi:hypothetical protein